MWNQSRDRKFFFNSLNKCVEIFLKYLKEIDQVSKHTLKAYRGDLQTLLFYLKDCCKNTDPNDLICHQNMRKLVSYLKQKNLGNRTIVRKMSTIRNFYSWELERDNSFLKTWLNANPMKLIKGPKISHSLPKALSVDETQKFLNTAYGKNSWINIRDKAIFELVYSSGLRVSEVQCLNLEKSRKCMGWIDFDQEMVIVFGKGSRWRKVPLGKVALRAINEWIKFRNDFNLTKRTENNETALFFNNRGQRLSVRSIQRRFSTHSIKNGRKVSVHPHMLRHSFASHLLQSSGNLRAVQEMLGHANITSTQIYTKLDHQHLAKIYDDSHPRAKLASD